ncbi:hypothetical protein BDY17DRAFT_311499 [Neohortaea acidophila]|uniref:Uncharacterized protein n=1 Tax=Neohortaea acidophila TaxID=245834 RepID=A0A6A6PQZ2_9PEZI|nr:uncharacterized protein BDY17DRAFT_311499 [Neohortaea acidophila]KAF2481863.1 hypothetical protein BDY17DRAFT_311499 [Neohortaea acidophila]
MATARYSLRSAGRANKQASSKMAASQSTTPSRKSKKRQTRLKNKMDQPVPGMERSVIIKADHTKTGFSDLPGEVRNRIYRLALSLTDRGPIPGSEDFEHCRYTRNDGDEEIMNTTNATFSDRYTRTQSDEESFRAEDSHFPPVSPIPFPLASDPTVYQDLALGLLRTCKAIHRETIGIFYHENTFRIDLIHQKSLRPNKRAEAFDEQGRPGLRRALKQISAQNLARIQAYVFVYNFHRPGHACGKGFDPFAKPLETTSLTFTKPAPHYRVTLLEFEVGWDGGFSAEAFFHVDYDSGCFSDHPTKIIENMLRSLSLHSMGSMHILSIADCIKQHSQDLFNMNR